ncbi:MAG TPA: TIGR03000 domain-containing protein [Pirellulales bacterium]|nr:TIGR03000 domain-containing protein [Pirellulales bacterium]
MLQHALKAGLIAAVLGLLVADANAFGHRGWGCGWGGYGGCGYGGYGYGGYGGWYAGYGGGWGYPGYYGGYAGCGYGGCGAAPAAAPGNAPMAPPATTPTPTPNPPATGTYNTPTSSTAVTSDRLMLAVNVPADAKVIINDRLTTSTGEHRTYVSNGVQPTANYSYRVQVDFVRDGKPVNEEKTVQLSGGKSVSLTFGGDAQTQVADVAASAQR